MSILNEHLAIKKLVELGIVIPGIISGNIGNIIYSPISIEDYLERIENNNIHDLGYNTRTMGRGIFTLDDEGMVINYKGVDSKLRNSDSIAVSSTEAEIETINGQDSYGINVIHFVDKNSRDNSTKSRLEFRVKGASQYQNLLNEKIKRDLIEKRDSRHLIKLPYFELPTPLTAKLCESHDLPRVIEVTDDFLSAIDNNSYAGWCLSQMEQNHIPYITRNQTWREYFTSYHHDKLDDEQLMQIVDREDSTYGLGAIFGQTTRVLENPFRIMEVQYFLKQNNLDALNAILDYSTHKEDNFLNNYADIMAKNAAGFMNLKLAINNFEHRQDYPLSGEICDDAFDDVSESLYVINPSHEDNFKKMQYYSQVYVFATNMKVLEDAYKLTGRPIPSDYKKHFVETFYNSLEDKANFKLCFQSPDPMSTIAFFNNAENNFKGMNDYIQDIRQIAVEVYKEHNPTNRASHPENKINSNEINTQNEI